MGYLLIIAFRDAVLNPSLRINLRLILFATTEAIYSLNGSAFLEGIDSIIRNISAISATSVEYLFPSFGDANSVGYIL